MKRESAVKVFVCLVDRPLTGGRARKAGLIASQLFGFLLDELLKKRRLDMCVLLAGCVVVVVVVSSC
jgi:high-affinity Fe2+/Pb2+ permease